MSVTDILKRVISLEDSYIELKKDIQDFPQFFGVLKGFLTRIDRHRLNYDTILSNKKELKKELGDGLNNDECFEYYSLLGDSVSIRGKTQTAELSSENETEPKQEIIPTENQTSLGSSVVVTPVHRNSAIPAPRPPRVFNVKPRDVTSPSKIPRRRMVTRVVKVEGFDSLARTQKKRLYLNPAVDYSGKVEGNEQLDSLIIDSTRTHIIDDVDAKEQRKSVVSKNDTSLSSENEYWLAKYSKQVSRQGKRKAVSSNNAKLLGVLSSMMFKKTSSPDKNPMEEEWKRLYRKEKGISYCSPSMKPSNASVKNVKKPVVRKLVF